MKRYAATYSNGQSMAALPVWVRMEKDGLHLQPRMDVRQPLPHCWPYDALVSSGPLLKGEQPLLGHRDRPGERLFIEDPAAVDELLRHAPQLSAGARRRRAFWPVMLGVAALLAVAALLQAGFSPARMVADMLPQALHDRLGRMVLAQLAGGRVCVHPDGEAALRTLQLKLAGSRQAMDRYRVFVGRLGVANAFTAPGGYIILSEKLIRMARSPDEVAGVLAHEMGHADLRHPEAGMVRAAGLSLVGMVLLGDSDLGSLAVLLAQMGFSRQAEREADRVSISRMHAANMDPAVLAAFLQRLEKGQGGAAGGLLALFRTHPPTPERMALLRKARLAGGRRALGKEQWQALRNICKRTMPLQQALDS